MTQKQLRKLTRKQLLELLLEQTTTIEKLEEQVDVLKHKLQSKVLTEEKAGSIAEAALKLNGVFGAAQAAADQYLNNVKILCETQKAQAEQAEAECRQKTEQMISETEKQCKEQKEEAERIVAEARALLLYAQKKSKKK